MSVYRFVPMVALATGTFAAPAGAVVITETFGTSTGDVAIGGSLVAQYSLAYAPASQPVAAKQTITPLGSSLVGPASTIYSFPTSEIGLASTSSEVKTTDPAVDQFVQLKFDINGKSNFGVATIGTDLSLVQIDYQSVVPEPAVWAEMITGLGLAGTALRTRRRRSATRAAA